jgi:ferric-dicitrate binding protein FerR (iron transport regulator)
MGSEDRFVVLIGLYADGLASEEEVRELEGLLRSDGSLRRAFVERMRLEADLASLYATETAALSVSPASRARRPLRLVRRGRHTNVRAAALAVAASLVMALGLWAAMREGQPDASAPSVASVAGRVDLIRDGRPGSRADLMRGARLRSGDRIVAHAGAAATLRYADGTAVALSGGSYLTVLAGEGGKRLLLSDGSLDADVARQPAGKAMVIETPHARAEVLGTRFSLSVGAAETRLDVREGAVRLASAAGGSAADVVTVRAGESAVAARGSGARLVAAGRAGTRVGDTREPDRSDGAKPQVRDRKDGNEKHPVRLRGTLAPKPEGAGRGVAAVLIAEARVGGDAGYPSRTTAEILAADELAATIGALAAEGAEVVVTGFQSAEGFVATAVERVVSGEKPRAAEHKGEAKKRQETEAKGEGK